MNFSGKPFSYFLSLFLSLSRICGSLLYQIMYLFSKSCEKLISSRRLSKFDQRIRFFCQKIKEFRKKRIADCLLAESNFKIEGFERKERRNFRVLFFLNLVLQFLLPSEFFWETVFIFSLSLSFSPSRGFVGRYHDLRSRYHSK